MYVEYTAPRRALAEASERAKDVSAGLRAPSVSVWWRCAPLTHERRREKEAE